MTARAFGYTTRPIELDFSTDVGDRDCEGDARGRTAPQLHPSHEPDAIARHASWAARGLNDIIAVIQSYACILEDSHDTSDARRQDATEIRLAAERATQLTRQLLTLGRHSAGAPKRTLLDELLADSLPALRRMLGSRVAVEVQHGGVPPVIIDRGYFEQVIMDLAVNARDAMGGDGRVTMETSTVELDVDGAALHGLKPGRYVVFAMTDTAPGVYPDAGEPSDLGLAIARGVVSQAGGALDVHRERGHGRTFRVRLPATSDAAAVSVRAVAVAPREAPAVRRSEPALQSRVLVVDDDPTLRRMLTRLLKRAAFDVVDVDTGRGALAVLESRRFDVIVSDIHMPDGDGLELLRAVRRTDLDIPVILMSGKPDVESAATALELGAFRYLTKPLESEAVEKVVRNAARAHALARVRREAMALAGHGEAGAADRAGLEVRFEQAIDKLSMVFQPIVEARSGALFGVEALMRTREPSIPSPPALLEVATQLKRLPMLGRRTRSLAGAALAARADIPSLFVNLHPDDLLDINLIDESAALTRIASRVILEVTEREALLTTPALLSRLERIRELGFRIAVDDIGAGYSGLTSFTDLTPEIVKLDMALVRSIHVSTVKQRTVGAICALCHEMGTLVVGEGVETADERDCLRAIGCDLLQGYLIARPSSELPPPA